MSAKGDCPMKKLLLLGGAQYLLPVIEEAHKLGLYVITPVTICPITSPISTPMNTATSAL